MQQAVYPQQPFHRVQLFHQMLHGSTSISHRGTRTGMLPVEQSYIENILRLNKGKLATVYATFENNTQWNAKIFKGYH